MMCMVVILKHVTVIHIMALKSRGKALKSRERALKSHGRLSILMAGL